MSNNEMASGKKILYFLKLGEVDQSIFDELKKGLEEVLKDYIDSVEIISDSFPLPKDSYISERDDYSAPFILSSISSKFQRYYYVIGITDKNLMLRRGDTTFILLHGLSRRWTSLISISRLRDNPRLYVNRFTKLASSLLGISFEIRSCDNICVVGYPIDLAELDSKPTKFCESCSNKLKIKMVEDYSKLLEGREKKKRLVEMELRRSESEVVSKILNFFNTSVFDSIPELLILKTTFNFEKIETLNEFEKIPYILQWIDEMDIDEKSIGFPIKLPFLSVIGKYPELMSTHNALISKITIDILKWIIDHKKLGYNVNRFLKDLVKSIKQIFHKIIDKFIQVFKERDSDGMLLISFALDLIYPSYLVKYFDEIMDAVLQTNKWLEFIKKLAAGLKNVHFDDILEVVFHSKKMLIFLEQLDTNLMKTHFLKILEKIFTYPPEHHKIMLDCYLVLLQENYNVQNYDILKEKLIFILNILATRRLKNEIDFYDYYSVGYPVELIQAISGTQLIIDCFDDMLNSLKMIREEVYYRINKKEYHKANIFSALINAAKGVGIFEEKKKEIILILEDLAVTSIHRENEQDYDSLLGLVKSSENAQELFKYQSFFTHEIIYDTISLLKLIIGKDNIEGEKEIQREVNLQCKFRFHKNREIDVECSFPGFKPLGSIAYWEHEVDEFLSQNFIRVRSGAYNSISYPDLNPPIEMHTMIYLYDDSTRYTGSVVVSINYTSRYQKFTNSRTVKDKSKLIQILSDEAIDCVNKSLKAAKVLEGVYAKVDDSDFELLETNKWEYFLQEEK